MGFLIHSLRHMTFFIYLHLDVIQFILKPFLPVLHLPISDTLYNLVYISALMQQYFVTGDNAQEIVQHQVVPMDVGIISTVNLS